VSWSAPYTQIPSWQYDEDTTDPAIAIKPWISFRGRNGARSKTFFCNRSPVRAVIWSGETSPLSTNPMKKLVCILILLSCVGGRADWKSFFHGTPPAATPGPPDAKTASVSFAAGVSADPQIMEFMQAFAEAMRMHDGKALKPRLSVKYSIEDMPDEHNAVDFFMQAMIKVKAPDEIVITAIERQGDVRVATIEFRAPDKTKTRTFKFDSAGKLLSADFFKLQFH